MNPLKKWVGYITKVIICIVMLGFVVKALYSNGLDDYYEHKDYDYENITSIPQSLERNDVTEMSQQFLARGNILDNLQIYIANKCDEEILISLYGADGECIVKKTINTADYKVNEWNTLGLTTEKLIRNNYYTINLSSEQPINSVGVVSKQIPEVYGICTEQGEELSDEMLALKFQFTYKYMTMGKVMELVFKMLFSSILLWALIYSIVNFEKLYKTWEKEKKINGLGIAIYFSVSLALIYNPLSAFRNQISIFRRVIGTGLISNVDVSKQIKNFNLWFVFFCITLVLYSLLSNYIITKDQTDEIKKAKDFLKHYVIVANCCLLFKCITFFNDESNNNTFMFSSYFALTIAIILSLFIVCKWNRYINLEKFTQLQLIGSMVGIFFAICISREYDQGRTLLGVCVFISLICIACSLLLHKIINTKKAGILITWMAVGTALIPVMTSLYIELIHILNQYEIFVAHPEKHYKIVGVFAFGLIISLVWL